MGPLLAPLLAVEFSNTERKFQNYSMYLCRQACTLSSVIFYHELDALYDLKISPSRPTVFKLILCFRQDLLITLNPASECDDLGFYTELNLYIFGFWTHRDVALPCPSLSMFLLFAFPLNGLLTVLMQINSKRLLTDNRSTSWTPLHSTGPWDWFAVVIYRQFCINCTFQTWTNFHASSCSLSLGIMKEETKSGIFQRLYFYQKYVFRRSRKR